MFQFQIPCEPVTGPHYSGPLRCYSDNEVGTLSTNIVSCCDYITSSNQTGLNNNSVKIYPNPSQKQECITVEVSDEKVKKMAIYNPTGQLIKNYGIAANKNATISIENSGNYIVCFKNKNDVIVYREKIVIE